MNFNFQQIKNKAKFTPTTRFFFPQNNQISRTILLVSQGFETILVSNKSSAENSILLCEIALGTRV